MSNSKSDNTKQDNTPAPFFWSEDQAEAPTGRVGEGKDEADASEMDDAIADRLRSLGYL